MKKLFIYGAGGLGRDIMDLAEVINQKNEKWIIEGFIDDNDNVIGKILNDYKVYSFEELNKVYKKEEVEISVAIGDPYIKKDIVNKIKRNGYKFAEIIHPNCYISRHNTIGQGAIICEGTVMTTGVNIGDFVIINKNCSIGHDVVINDYVTISPGSNISGNVNIGEMTYIGSGVNIRDELTIGDGTIVGIGSTVVKNIPSDVVVVGNPARVLKENIEKKVFK